MNSRSFSNWYSIGKYFLLNTSTNQSHPMTTRNRGPTPPTIVNNLLVASHQNRASPFNIKVVNTTILV
ncbi:hypothetical protein LguiA_013596 [Lonicera macranthoides]